jgi:hypothetical protein
MKKIIEQFFRGKIGYIFNYKDLKECMELIDAMFADKKQLEDKISKIEQFVCSNYFFEATHFEEDCDKSIYDFNKKSEEARQKLISIIKGGNDK